MKAKIFLLSTIILLTLTGCSKNNNSTETSISKEKYDEIVAERDAAIEELNLLKKNISQDNVPSNEASTNKTSTTKNAFDEDNLLKQLDITEYKWSSRLYQYVSLIVKNNSEYTLNIEGKMMFYDSENNIIGTSTSKEYAFEAGQEMYLSFYNEEEYDSYDYSFNLKEEKNYNPVLSSLDYEVNETDEKLIISIVNNGELNAEFVQYYLLYFNGDNLIQVQQGYAVDSDSEIKSGNTEVVDFRKIKEDFDSYKVLLSGRSSK